MALKEWVLQFNLAAKQNSNFSSTFKAAQSALAETQNRIQQLNKVQSDITAYQKQQQAVDSTKQRLAVLQQQYDSIQKEIQETEGSPISINFAPVYNFSGVSDTQQFESLLTSHDDDMREYILGVVEEAEHDKFRRAYA